MGYYDDYDGYFPEKKKSNLEKVGRVFLWVIVGSFLTFVLYGGITNLEFMNNSTSNNKTEVPLNKVADTVRSVDINTPMTEAADRVKDSVVGIANIKNVSDFFSQGTTSTQEQGSGSGVIYKQENGIVYIITNNHVVDNADALEVTLSTGEKRDATIIGKDQLMDLAVISYSSDTEVTVAEFGDSAMLKLAEPVIAIGNPLGLELSGSITKGIVSGLDRLVPISDENGNEIWSAVVIQTDAAINPGNSGGALVNAEGQVIGINSMKVSQAATEGIGFAIPVNNALPIINELEQEGFITRPLFGIELAGVEGLSDYSRQKELGLPEDVKTGVIIMRFSENSPAQQSGLKQFDVIVSLAGQEVNSPTDFKKILYSAVSPEETIEVKYYRDGNLETTSVKVGSYRDGN